jgi:uncharacterized protein (TIGR00369 family)
VSTTGPNDPPDDRPTPDFGQQGSGVAAYLRMSVSEVSDGTEPVALLEGRFDARADVVDAEGRTPTGVLGAMVDSIGGLSCGIASLPDWIVTTNLSVRRAPSSLAGPSGTGPLRFETETLRRGRSAVVSRTLVTADDDGTPVATGWMTTAVLTPAHGPPEVTRPVRPLDLPEATDPVFSRPPAEFFGLRAGARPGVVALDMADRVRNPWGILHGGSMAILVDVAATSAVAGVPALEPTMGLVTSDLVVHYLSPGRVGPVVAAAGVVGRRGDEQVVRVSVVDHGADDRPLVLAMVAVRRIGPHGATVR